MDKRLVMLIIILAIYSYSFSASPIKVLTQYGTPLSNGVVKVTYLDNTSKICVLDGNGELILKDVPLGIVRIKILSWKNISINFEKTVTSRNSTVIYNGTGILYISVKDFLDNPIEGVEIRIMYRNNIIEISSTNSSGIYVIELPNGNYSISLKYYKEDIESNLNVKAGRVNMYVFKFNVLRLFGKIALSFTEFILLILSIFILVIVIVIILYEYHLWRRRRLLKSMVVYKDKNR